jgi:hypothetical protein
MGHKALFQPGQSGNPGTKFQPGRSGNPLGRSKTMIEIQNLARQHAPTAIARLAELAGLVAGEKADTHVAQIAAIKELLDRGLGRAPLILEGDPDRPYVIRYDFRWADAKTNTIPGEDAPAVAAPIIEAAVAADGNGVNDEIEIVWGTDTGDGSD